MTSVLSTLCSPAFRRSAISIVAGSVVCAVLTLAFIVAPTMELTSENVESHDAASKPRFTSQAQAVTTTTEKKSIGVVKPKQKSSSKLLAIVDQTDILSRHRILADRVLRALPSGCRDNLRNFYVNYDKNAANRGLGGESTIIVVGTVPDREFMALIVHECGHVVDLGELRGTPASGVSGFYDGNTPIYNDDASVAFYQISWLSPNMMQPLSRGTDFVSGYAASDPFEDFAEAFAFYALQPAEFANLAKTNPVLNAKYNYMKNIVFVESTPVGNGEFVRGPNVPWDITKLPYTWNAL